MPGYRSTLKYASAIIAGSKHTHQELPNWTQTKRVYIPENGVDIARFNQHRERRATVPLRGAFVGRLVPYKGADMLLEAASEFVTRGQLELDLIGDGPQRPLLEIMADSIGIRSKVNFHGWTPHIEVQAKLRECDFMALPSIREFGGAVAVEAMALGVTPIVADYGGPSELVDDETGIRVPFSDKTFGAAGRRKVLEKLTWDAKANQILAVYQAVLSGSADLRNLDFH
jgi:glycosyltransferase involved in cell wall biosynthesis